MKEELTFYPSSITLLHEIISYSYFFMAHKKAGGSTSLGRDSQGKRLGYAAVGGVVKFTQKKKANFHGALKRRVFANVEEWKK